MTPSARTRWPALVVLVAVLLLAVGVVVAQLPGDDDEPGREATTTAAATESIEAGWTADLSAVGPDPVLRRTGDLLAFVGTSTVVALDRATGEQRWTTPISGRCAVSDPTAAGVVAVVTGPGCADVVALDLTEGSALWTSAWTSGPAQDLAVAVSEQTVTVVADCGDVARLRISDGSRLARVAAARDGACSDAHAATDGRTIVVHRAGETSGGLLRAVDADTGTVVVDRDVAGYTQELEVVSSDPLVVTADEPDGVATRVYDVATGRPGPVLVRGTYGIRVLDAVDGVMVGSTQAEAGEVVLRGYDLEAGRPSWAHLLDVDSTVLGTDDAGVVVTSPVDPGTGTVPTLLSLERLDRSDAGRELLGTVDLQVVTRAASRWVAGDYLGALDEGGRLTSYTVPARGDVVAANASPAAGPTPDDVLDACGTIRPASLRVLGIRASSPAPYDCTWTGLATSADHRLEVQVHAGRASYGSADEDVARWVESQRSGMEDAVYAPTFVTSPAASEVLGWADGGWVSQAFSPNGTDSYTAVVVRSGNVGVVVEASTEAPLAGPGRVAGYELQRAVVAVATDVLRGIGIAAGPPAGGRSGPVGSLPDVCTTLADVAATASGGVVPQPQGAVRDPEGRVGGCSWGDDLIVTAYAVPASRVDGASGTDLATAALEDACSIGSRVRGVAEAACRYDYADDATEGAGTYRSATVTARSGNLLVQVDYGRDGSPTRQEVRATAQQLARTAVARLR